MGAFWDVLDIFSRWTLCSRERRLAGKIKNGNILPPPALGDNAGHLV